MKKSLLTSFGFFFILSLNAQSWIQETNFLNNTFWYDIYPTNITGFRAATVEKWQSGAWVNAYRLTIPQLDAKNAPLSIENSLWDKTKNSFIRFSRLNCINNANGKHVSLRNQTFVTATQTWKDSYRDSATYNAAGLPFIKTSLGLYPTGYLGDQRDSFIYYPNNNLKTKFQQLIAVVIATGERVWVEDQRDSFVYDANNRLIEWHQDPWVGRYVVLQRHFIGYDAQGRRSYLTREGHNGSGWDTMFRYDYTYNAQGQLAEMVRKQRLVAGVYANHTRFSYTYNTNGLVQQELMESFITGIWVNNTRTTYSYTPLSIESLFLPEHLLNLYPNPSAEGTALKIQVSDPNLSIKTIQIYDVMGHLIQTTTPPFSHKSIEIKPQNLTKGLYFVKIETLDGKFLTKKWSVF
jgi:hypothetical protein